MYIYININSNNLHQIRLDQIKETTDSLELGYKQKSYFLFNTA